MKKKKKIPKKISKSVCSKSFGKICKKKLPEFLEYKKYLFLEEKGNKKLTAQTTYFAPSLVSSLANMNNTMFHKSLPTPPLRIKRKCLLPSKSVPPPLPKNHHIKNELAYSSSSPVSSANVSVKLRVYFLPHKKSSIYFCCLESVSWYHSGHGYFSQTDIAICNPT